MTRSTDHISDIYATSRYVCDGYIYQSKKGNNASLGILQQCLIDEDIRAQIGLCDKKYFSSFFSALDSERRKVSLIDLLRPSFIFDLA